MKKSKCNALGLGTCRKKHWSGGTPIAGQQQEYTFDDIGNRTQTKAGGDQGGASLRSATYGANFVNQSTNRTVPGAMDVMGVALATSTVNISGEAPYRKGEYFRKELPLDNSTSAVWTNVTVTATGQSSISGHAFVPAMPESFRHDLDGNLNDDGRWNFTWDAENRLVQMVAWTAAGPQQLLKFEYDWQGRRIHKQVWDNTGGTNSPSLDQKFVYDGWNLIATLNSQLSTLNSFLWGLDLSGSLQGAGGVGGLLRVSSGTTNCFAAFDGNGNVVGLTSAADGAPMAQYEYGPFGELIRATYASPLVRQSLGGGGLRFSTKYQDDETDLLYYGYRYYDPSTGRWANRDPINELGFKLLARSGGVFRRSEGESLGKVSTHSLVHSCASRGGFFAGRISRHANHSKASSPTVPHTCARLSQQGPFGTLHMSHTSWHIIWIQHITNHLRNTVLLARLMPYHPPYAKQA